MTLQHTPGPWRITRANDLPNAIVAPDADLGTVGVAKVVILNDHEANAKLIAAAPDLFDALSDAVLAMMDLRDRYLHNTTTGSEVWQECGAEALNRAVAALAKVSS